ncbi:hypothetical protein VaNZ11_011075 [Volvox africanus]|uniref:VWFA domain-containing protein n=1 Tax=Volvox africanus TaxID=51714 RepID=A0ABQ5SBR1_9CHLO|nr:hypothetical protein VaNZ11_011075 [Volvox africanus]
MEVETFSENGESAGPPSAEPPNDLGKILSYDEIPEANGESSAEKVAAAFTTPRVVDKEAKLIDVAFLIDGADRQREVLEILRHKLNIIEDRVKGKHPGVSLRVAFLGYCSYPIVADLRQIGEGIFQEAVSVVLLRDKEEREGQDVLKGLDEVSCLSWSAQSRLLVHVSDFRGIPPGGDKRNNETDGSGTSLTSRNLAALQHLKECGLKKYYLAHFKAETQHLIEELRMSGIGEDGDGDAQWLVSERLYDPEVLPYKVAELVLDLLDRPTAGSLPEEPAEPTEQVRIRFPGAAGGGGGGQAPRSPSVASNFTADLKVTTPYSEVGPGQVSHRYRASSEDGAGPGPVTINESFQPTETDESSFRELPSRLPTGAGPNSGGGAIGDGPYVISSSDAGSNPSAFKGQRSLETVTSRSSSKSASTVPRNGTDSIRPYDETSSFEHGGSLTTGNIIQHMMMGRDSLSSVIDEVRSEVPSVAGYERRLSKADQTALGSGSSGKVTPKSRASSAGGAPDTSGHHARSSEIENTVNKGTRTKASETEVIPQAAVTSGTSTSASASSSSNVIPSQGRLTTSDAGSAHKSTKSSGPASEGGSGQVTPKNRRSASPSVSGVASVPTTGAPGQIGPSSEAHSFSARSSSVKSIPTPGILSIASDNSGATLPSQGTAAPVEVGSAPSIMPLALPWSNRALDDFKSEMRKASFKLLDPADEPLSARMDAVFALPPELWPVLPPGAMYCMEASDPRVTFGYLQHRDFPETKVRVNTYFGKWGRHLVDYVVSWQPTPRAEAAWQLADGKQPPLPWEQRQVVAHTTNGEYQYANTRMRFRGPKSAKPDSEVVEYSDAHAVDLLDTKAANETAPRNSDKDREAHLIDPPRPNTWGELARRPLIGNLRSRGGGTYVHHINYDHSSLRTTCGRRLPAGYFFTLIPNAVLKPPAVPGGGGGGGDSYTRSRPSSAGRVIAAVRQSRSFSSTIAESPSLLHRIRGTASRDSASTAPNSGSGAVRRSGLVKRGGGGAAGGPPMTSSPSVLSVVGLDVRRLVPKDRWRTYDVPFNHPIHSARAQELGADMAVASGRGVRTFSDAAAVLQVSEQELRLPRAFVPGPVVVPTWDDIPRLYAEHMEAARALMPVTELDTYGSSKLHMLIYHLQCAATLEYDRLDAKLLLLPQMARLGRKSAEIDAWLQATVEHASYLYDKLQIYDTSIWTTDSKDKPPQLLRSSLAALPPPPLPAATAIAATAPGQSQGWAFPDPLKGTAHASRSAVNVSVQRRPLLRQQQVAVQIVTKAEWSAVAGVMNPARHATLYDVWVRLRPVMTGAAPPGNGASYGSSRAGSMIAASSDAGATASGEGDRLPEPQDPYVHGSVNRELLDYVPKDLEAMSSPDFTPQAPAPAKLPKQRGYRGEGPLPLELVAEMPTVHRPVRCRGADETPLPPEYQTMDLWNIRHKAEQAPDNVPHSRDKGAVGASQVAIQRLKAVREFSSTHQAAVWKSMQLAKGVRPSDQSDAPYYGSDIAEEDSVTEINSEVNGGGANMPRRRVRVVPPRQDVSINGRPGAATQTEGDLGKPTPEEVARETQCKQAELEAAETRKLLTSGKLGATREQVLENALKAAEAAIESLKPRPIGYGINIPAEPDHPRLLFAADEPRDVALAYRPRPLEHSHPEVLPNHWYKRSDSISSQTATANEKGPEPFSLEKIWRDEHGSDHGSGVDAIPLTDLPTAKGGVFGDRTVAGFSALADYEVALARRRAIAGAEVVHLRANYIPKEDVFNLLVVYCNLDRHPDQVQMLQRAIDAPVSVWAVAAAARAATATAAASGPAAAAAAAAAKHTSVKLQAESEQEAIKQRIRSIAWLLGVTWRRITNETYTSFLSRVLGFPNDAMATLHRTRAAHLIARALVRGHDMNSVTKLTTRY